LKTRITFVDSCLKGESQIPAYVPRPRPNIESAQDIQEDSIWNNELWDGLSSWTETFAVGVLRQKTCDANFHASTCLESHRRWQRAGQGGLIGKFRPAAITPYFHGRVSYSARCQNNVTTTLLSDPSFKRRVSDCRYAK
jgi:hypothetical protein